MNAVTPEADSRNRTAQRERVYPSHCHRYTFEGHRFFVCLVKRFEAPSSRFGFAVRIDMLIV